MRSKITLGILAAALVLVLSVIILLMYNVTPESEEGTNTTSRELLPTPVDYEYKNEEYGFSFVFKTKAAEDFIVNEDVTTSDGPYLDKAQDIYAFWFKTDDENFGTIINGKRYVKAAYVVVSPKKDFDTNFPLFEYSYYRKMGENETAIFWMDRVTTELPDDVPIRDIINEPMATFRLE